MRDKEMPFALLVILLVALAVAVVFAIFLVVRRWPPSNLFRRVPFVRWGGSPLRPKMLSLGEKTSEIPET